MSNDFISNFIGGAPLPPDPCECEVAHGPCFFGAECSELTAVLTSVCIATPPSGCAYIATQSDVTIILTWDETLATEEMAAWSYTTTELVGEVWTDFTSTVYYHEECGWSASFNCRHVALCPDGCGDGEAVHVPTCYCEIHDPPSPCDGCENCAEAVPKSIPEFVGSDSIAEEFFGCTPDPCNVGWKTVDVSLSSPCKNTDLACSGFRGYMGICAAVL